MIGVEIFPGVVIFMPWLDAYLFTRYPNGCMSN